RVDAAVEVAAPERRDDVLLDDAIGRRIGQRTLEPVSDFDAHASIVERDDQQRAVIDVLAADLPLLDDADRVLIDLLGWGGRYDQHRNLRALRLLERAQLGLESGRLVGRQRLREIRNARLELGYRTEPLLCEQRQPRTG